MGSLWTFPSKAKALRAEMLARRLGPGARVVCFSCGHAAAALRTAGLDVLEVGPKGPLQASRWWGWHEVRSTWPDRFDATPGHLPMPAMVDLARVYFAHLGPLPVASVHKVPCGSGETYVALALAYPMVEFVPVYGDDPATRWDPDNPVNQAVLALSGRPCRHPRTEDEEGDHVASTVAPNGRDAGARRVREWRARDPGESPAAVAGGPQRGVRGDHGRGGDWDGDAPAP